MEPEIILAHLRALLERTPDFDEYSSASREHLIWLGQAHALVSRWSRVDSIQFQVCSDHLSSVTLRENNVATILGILHRAIADLELSTPDKTKVVFAAGEVYDFFRELNNVIESADKTIFIVDPYLDPEVFDQYLTSRKPEVTVRLLLSKNSSSVKPAAEKYIEQHGDVIEIKKSKKTHDRVIFVDDQVCWEVGQSLNHAAKAKPTYLAPLAPDVVSAKLEEYNSIWCDANSI